MLTIGAAEDPHGVLPAEREWAVTVLGVEHEPLAASGPTGEPLRVEAGADPRPRTPHREDALFAVLDAAQYSNGAKQTAWRTLGSELSPAAKLAELHAQGLPRELIGALSELLTAEG